MSPRFVAICVLTLAAFLGPQAAALAKGKDEHKNKAKEASYLVVDVSGSLELVKAKELKTFKKELSKAHKAAVKSHAEAKKAARKAKEKFTEPKPKSPKVKVLSKRPQPESDARALLDKITEERAKKAAKSKKGKKG